MITLNEAEAVKAGLSAVEEKDESIVFKALDSLTGIATGFLSENKEADVQRIINSIEAIAQGCCRKRNGTCYHQFRSGPGKTGKGQQQKKDTNPL